MFSGNEYMIFYTRNDTEYESYTIDEMRIKDFIKKYNQSNKVKIKGYKFQPTMISEFIDVKNISKYENKSGKLFRINVNNKNIRVDSDHLVLTFINGKEEVMTAEKLYEIKKDKTVMIPTEYGLQPFDFIEHLKCFDNVYDIEFQDSYGVSANTIITV